MNVFIQMQRKSDLVFIDTVVKKLSDHINTNIYICTYTYIYVNLYKYKKKAT